MGKNLRESVYLLILHGILLSSVYESVQDRIGFKSLQNIGLFLLYRFSLIQNVNSLGQGLYRPCPLRPLIR